MPDGTIENVIQHVEGNMLQGRQLAAFSEDELVKYIAELSELAEGYRTGAQARAEQAIAYAWYTGQALIFGKERVGHGNFTRWVEAKFDIEMRTAQRYMKLTKTSHVSDLIESGKSIRAAYLKLGILPDKEVVDTGERVASSPEHYRHINALCRYINTKDEWTDTEIKEFKQLKRLLDELFGDIPKL